MLPGGRSIVTKRPVKFPASPDGFSAGLYRCAFTGRLKALQRSVFCGGFALFMRDWIMRGEPREIMLKDR
jgi:hypothetical protein